MMEGALKQAHSLHSAEHSFLLQPHTYSSGDDGDSPPSLTNSSESPRSASEEGGHSAAGPSMNGLTSSRLPGKGKMPLATSRRSHKSDLGPHAASFTGMMYDAAGEQETGVFPAHNGAASPNWEAVFGEDSNGFAPPIETAGPESKANYQQSAGFDGQNQSQSSEQPSPEPNWVTGVSRWQQQQQTGMHEINGNEGGDAKMNDDALFASLIQEDSFDDSKDDSASGSEQSSSQMDLSVPKLPNGLVFSANGAAPGEITPPQSAHVSTSQLSSRRNSVDQDLGSLSSKVVARIPHSGSHYSHTSDADLPSSSQIVVRPALKDLNGLQVHVHGIAASGAKSRVETQIRLRLELVRSSENAAVSGPFERIGAFQHIKLPPMTGTKRRSKKHKPTDIVAEKTLFMDAAVVRATPPHERVFVCRSCQQREKKRAQRRKTGVRRENGRGGEEDLFSREDMQELGVDPEAPDAQLKARLRTEQEDERRVVVFNCGDFVAFEEGTCILPTRITCYCRHHREKTGFCLVFTMRNYRGDVIATGSTPPIMITDDHKSVGAAATNANAKKNDLPASRSRAQSSDIAPPTLDQRGPSRSVSGDAKTKRRQHRSKPYGEAEERSNARRGTASSSVSATPHALSTGQNTPLLAMSPTNGPDLRQPDFWNAFAAMTNITNSGSPPDESKSNASAHTPLDTNSPTAGSTSQPLISPNMQSLIASEAPPMQDWVNSAAAQGSLSSQTLQMGPHSLPGFDMNAFLQSIQRSQDQGDDASMQQLMMLARSLPSSSFDAFGNSMGSVAQRQAQSSSAQMAPMPNISKLIPGEGPTSGGIEVTILGEHFEEGQTCFFGDVPATSTRVWGSNTLLCILPPSASPGPVAVTVKGGNISEQTHAEHQSRTLQLFTYTDTTDRALMELALQVVGLQMTGQMQSARDVAMRVVGSGPNQGMSRSTSSGQASGSSQQQSGAAQNGATRDAVTGIFTGASGSHSFQNSVLGFLKMLDVDLGSNAVVSQRRDAIRLANKQGHTLLHLCAILGFHRLALDVIRRGCPVNARDHAGMTALHYCALRGRVTLARLLLANDAFANVESVAGMTPLDVALEQDQADIEALLDDVSTTEEDAESTGSSLEVVSQGTISDIDDDIQSSIVDDSALAESDADDTPQTQRRFSSDDEKMVASLAAPNNVEEDREKSLLRSADAKAGTESSCNAEKSLDNEKENTQDSASGLKALVHGGLDFAARARFGMPLVLHEGLNNLQMPVISVFQMALPPSLTSWAFLTDASPETGGGDPPNEHLRGKSREFGTDNAESSSSRQVSRWRNIVEESTLWINPLSNPPPPAYESLAKSDCSDGIRRDEAHRSPQQCIESTEPNSSQASSSALASTSNPALHARGRARQSKLLAVSRHDERISSAKATTQRTLRDDRMLVYFWLPILVFVLLLLCFAKPSSVLSFEDLRSFIMVF